jgi:glycosyltransferase involved in cell wall biosynthesis
MHTKATLDVSMVVANFNNGRYLEDFFHSILGSTSLPREIIFVDDALNVGVATCSGTFIMRMDPDDILLPTRIERQFDYITKSGLDVVGSNAVIFHGSTGAPVGSTNFPLEHEDIARTILKGEHGVLHPTVLGRASFFKRVPYIQENVPAEDYDIFARFLKCGAKFGNVTDPLIRYRIHDESASSRLRFSTIAKTYRLRDSIFGGYTPHWRVVTYYWFIKSYRNYLGSRSPLSRSAWAALSSLCYPQKLARKIATWAAYRQGGNHGRPNS